MLLRRFAQYFFILSETMRRSSMLIDLRPLLLTTANSLRGDAVRCNSSNEAMT